MKRYLPAVLTLIAGLALGTAVGAYLGYRYGKADQSLLIAGRLAWAGTLATNQYLEADYPQAREALLAYVHALEVVRGERHELLPENMLTLDLGLTHGRLALLEERNGHPEAAAEEMAAAVEYLRLADWKDPSEPRLRELLRRIDAPTGNDQTVP